MERRVWLPVTHDYKSSIENVCGWVEGDGEGGLVVEFKEDFRITREQLFNVFGAVEAELISGSDDNIKKFKIKQWALQYREKTC